MTLNPNIQFFPPIYARLANVYFEFITCILRYASVDFFKVDSQNHLSILK